MSENAASLPNYNKYPGLGMILSHVQAMRGVQALMSPLAPLSEFPVNYKNELLFDVLDEVAQRLREECGHELVRLYSLKCSLDIEHAKFRLVAEVPDGLFEFSVDFSFPEFFREVEGWENKLFHAMETGKLQADQVFTFHQIVEVAVRSTYVLRFQPSPVREKHNGK